MPTKKIADQPAAETCLSREHLPPAHVVWRPGAYQHRCPACGHITSFTIHSVLH